jgi:hypothetical protein
MRRPSPAIVIAVLALAGTWGGPAVAAQLIGSREVRDGSLTARDVKDRSLLGRDMKSNTLTGRVVAGLSGRDVLDDSLDGSDIDESTLGEVPRAAGAGTADTATRATTAGSADALTSARVTRVLYARPVNDETATVLDEGGLRLRARCTAGGALSVEAVASNSSGGVVHVSASRPSANGAVAEAAADNDLRAADVVDVLPAGADNVTGALAWYAPSGETITIDYLAQQGLGAARGYQCLFAGTAVHGTA